MQSAIASIAKLTPPSKRGVYNTKAGIRELRQKIEKQFNPKSAPEGVPAAKDTIFSWNERSISGLYIKKKVKGKGKRKERKTVLPTFSDENSAFAWYLKHSKLSDKSHRSKSDNAVAFVSSRSVISGIVKKLKQRAGNLIAGWKALADKYDANINKHLLKGNLDYKGSVVEHGEDVYAYNEAQNNNPKLEQYVQYILDRDLPKQIEYHMKATEPFLIKSIQKQFDLKQAEAKAVIAQISF